MQGAAENVIHDRLNGCAKLAKDITPKFIEEFNKFAKDIQWKCEKPRPELAL
jgi:hypothetical protein